jgi:hypothetical protein
MSSTVRVFVNDKRVATGKPWNNKFLQVFPAEKAFGTEGEWRSFVYQTVLNGIRFETGEDSETETVPAPAPAPAPSLSTMPSTRASDWTYKDVTKATLPAGKYYIGDLCYALDDTIYDKVFGPNYDTGLFTLKKNPNHVFWMKHTHGDGCFRGSDGKEYCVDAAILGIAAYSILDPKKAPYDGGHLYTFTSPVLVQLKGEKFIFHGEHYNDHHITINLYEDEEDYCESE